MIPSIVYEDNHLIIINKPAGTLSQPESSNLSQDSSIFGQVYRFLQEREKKTNVFLRLNQRLDKPVSGIMIFSKTSKATERINACLRHRQGIGKFYLAVVCGKLIVDELIESSLFRSLPDVQLNTNTASKYADLREEKISMKLGMSHFESMQHFTDANRRHPTTPLTLVKIKLITGRKHQIRSQLASLGHPIYNDYLYNAPYPVKSGDFPSHMIALHSHHLILQHPIKKEQETMINLTCEVPEEWKKYFSNCNFTSDHYR